MLSFDSKFDVCSPRKIVAQFDDYEKMDAVVSGKLRHDWRNRGTILDQVEYCIDVGVQIMTHLKRMYHSYSFVGSETL